MSDPTLPSFPERYWEAARCVAASGREFARLWLNGVGYASHALIGHERRTAEALRGDGPRFVALVVRHVHTMLRTPARQGL
jgi:hypothetical protein